MVGTAAENATDGHNNKKETTNSGKQNLSEQLMDSVRTSTHQTRHYAHQSTDWRHIRPRALGSAAGTVRRTRSHRRTGRRYSLSPTLGPRHKSNPELHDEQRHVKPGST